MLMEMWVPVTTARCVLGLLMEDTDMETKQSRTTDKEWYSSLRFGWGVNNSHSKKQLVINCYTEPWTWTFKHGLLWTR